MTELYTPINTLEKQIQKPTDIPSEMPNLNPAQYSQDIQMPYGANDQEITNHLSNTLPKTFHEAARRGAVFAGGVITTSDEKIPESILYELNMSLIDEHLKLIPNGIKRNNKSTPQFSYMLIDTYNTQPC